MSISAAHVSTFGDSAVGGRASCTARAAFGPIVCIDGHEGGLACDDTDHIPQGAIVPIDVCITNWSVLPSASSGTGPDAELNDGAEIKVTLCEVEDETDNRRGCSALTNPQWESYSSYGISWNGKDLLTVSPAIHLPWGTQVCLGRIKATATNYIPPEGRWTIRAGTEDMTVTNQECNRL